MALKTVKTTTDLGQYKLNKGLRGLLEHFDRMCEWESRGGRPLPRAVRLFRHYLNAIGEAVRSQSDGKISVREVLYRGLPLIAHDEKEPEFALRSAP